MKLGYRLLVAFVVAIAGMTGCGVCAVAYVAMSRSLANYELSQTPVAEQPPTQTALPLRPTATIQPTVTMQPATPEPIIVSVQDILGGDKTTVTEYLGQPIWDDPIPNDDDSVPGGTHVGYSYTVDGYEMLIMMDFDRRDHPVFLSIFNLDPWQIPLNAWPRMAKRLQIPFEFDDTASCLRSFRTGPLGRNWSDCHGYSSGFNANIDTGWITQFFIIGREP